MKIGDKYSEAKHEIQDRRNHSSSRRIRRVYHRAERRVAKDSLRRGDW